MKTISLGDFKDYSFDKKCDIVTIHSNYIMHHDIQHGKAYLYHTGSFFIEVRYSTIQRKILKIHAFNESIELKDYVDTISLADLRL